MHRNETVVGADMAAVTRRRYGGLEAARIERVASPFPTKDEVIVRVHAASVCKGDIHLLTGKPYLLRLAGYGLLRPVEPVMGQSFAGRVVSVGSAVEGIAPGDEVYGQVDGAAFAEFVRVPPERLAPKPSNLTFDEAAAAPDALTALQALRDVGKLEPGQRVLINGASGGVGTFAVQIAKAMGATVTAVCSARNAELVKSLGADRVVDYGREDFARLGIEHDVFLDLVGNRPLRDCLRVLGRKGVFVACAGDPGGQWIGPILWMLKVIVTGAVTGRKMLPFVMKPNREDLLVLKTWLEDGSVSPVVEKRLALPEAIAAIAHVMHGHTRGKTVIVVDQEGCAAAGAQGAALRLPVPAL